VIAEQLQKTDLFKEVELGDLQALVERMSQEHYDSGAVLFHAGDTGDAMYIIQSGSIRIYMNDDEGKEITLTRYGQNEIFGELSPIDERPRSASAAANDPLDVLVLHRQDFLAFLNERPQIGLAMMRSLSHRLRYTTTYLEEFKPAEFETPPVSHGEELRRPAQQPVADIIDEVNKPTDDEPIHVPAHVEPKEKPPGGMGIFDRIANLNEEKSSEDESAEDN
jgi:CRP-like cAMP-binding protein